jgi:hypothetical protein
MAKCVDASAVDRHRMVGEKPADHLAPFRTTALFFIEVLYAYGGEFKFSRHTQ